MYKRLRIQKCPLPKIPRFKNFIFFSTDSSFEKPKFLLKQFLFRVFTIFLVFYVSTET